MYHVNIPSFARIGNRIHNQPLISPARFLVRAAEPVLAFDRLPLPLQSTRRVIWLCRGSAEHGGHPEIEELLGRAEKRQWNVSGL